MHIMHSMHSLCTEFPAATGMCFSACQNIFGGGRVQSELVKCMLNKACNFSKLDSDYQKNRDILSLTITDKKVLSVGFE